MSIACEALAPRVTNFTTRNSNLLSNSRHSKLDCRVQCRHIHSMWGTVQQYYISRGLVGIRWVWAMASFICNTLPTTTCSVTYFSFKYRYQTLSFRPSWQLVLMIGRQPNALKDFITTTSEISRSFLLKSFTVIHG